MDATFHVQVGEDPDVVNHHCTVKAPGWCITLVVRANPDMKWNTRMRRHGRPGIFTDVQVGLLYNYRRASVGSSTVSSVGLGVGKGGAATLASVDGMQDAVTTLPDTQPCPPAPAGSQCTTMCRHRFSLQLQRLHPEAESRLGAHMLSPAQSGH